MTITNYFWDPLQDNVVKEYDDNVDTIVRYTTEPGLYGNLISQERDGVASYHHFDGQGSTLVLTDVDGQVVGTYSYNAFGQVVHKAGAIENTRQYVGEFGYECDELDRFCVRARCFAAAISRWLSVDTLPPKVGIGAYTYVNNMPVDEIDPSGNFGIRNQVSFFRSCGYLCSAVDWRLDRGETTGFIIQRISFSGIIASCKEIGNLGREMYYMPDCDRSKGLLGSAAAEGFYPADKEKSGKLIYWEMWPVVDSDIYSSRTKVAPATAYHDRVGLPTFQKSESIEEIVIEATAWFVKGETPPGGWKLWESGQERPVFAAGGLLAICESEALGAGLSIPERGSTRRKWEASWNCCCEDCKTEVHEYGWPESGGFSVTRWNFSDCQLPRLGDCINKRR